MTPAERTIFDKYWTHFAFSMVTENSRQSKTPTLTDAYKGSQKENNFFKETSFNDLAGYKYELENTNLTVQTLHLRHALVKFQYTNNESTQAIKIVENMFRGIQSFQHPVILSSSAVTKIGKNAFRDSNVYEITIPHVTTLGESAFQNTDLGEKSAHGKVQFPLVTVIPNNCFAECRKVTEFDFPQVEAVRKNAFKTVSICESFD